MKKYLIVIAISILWITICAYSQSLDYAKTNQIMNEFSKSAVFIQTPQGSGTGTLFAVPFTDTSTAAAPYVATAKHVLERNDSLSKSIGSFDTVSVFLNVRLGNKESRKYSVLYKSDLLDIAVLRPIEFKRPFDDYDTFVPRVDDIAKYSEIRKGQTTFIAGYPFAIGTEHKIIDPVIQSGIVSHVDSIESRVLIDIPVNLGNSGCPVYVLSMDGSVKLLGLVFQYEPSRADVVIRPSLNSAVPANTSLGRVVLLQRIITDLKSLPH